MYKKRYIYSSFISIIFFIILYVILDFHLLVSLIFTILSYIGGIFLYKEKDIRSYNPNLLLHYCYLISKIDNYKSSINEEVVKRNIEDITKSSEKIVAMLEQKPTKVTQVYDGFDFYLPITINVLEQYVYLTKKEKLTKTEDKFLKEINLCLDNIEREINKLLENMNYTKMLDINSRIEIFKNDNKIVNNKKIKEGVNENVERR